MYLPAFHRAHSKTWIALVASLFTAACTTSATVSPTPAPTIMIGTPTSVIATAVPTLTPTMPAPESDEWQEYLNDVYHVSVWHPANWAQVETLRVAGFRGTDGFFAVSAISDPEGVGLSAVCESQAHHKLLPFGSQPQIINQSVDGQPACLILPSNDQRADPNLPTLSQVIAQYPQPILRGDTPYHYLVLDSDQAHIRAIAERLTFILFPPTPEPTVGTLGTVCAAQHTVQPGERLFRIGQQYGVDWQVIARVNNLADPALIYAGQVLCIPTSGTSAFTPVPPPSTTLTHYSNPRMGFAVDYPVAWGGATDPSLSIPTQMGLCQAMPQPCLVASFLRERDQYFLSVQTWPSRGKTLDEEADRFRDHPLKKSITLGGQPAWEFAYFLPGDRDILTTHGGWTYLIRVPVPSSLARSQNPEEVEAFLRSFQFIPITSVPLAVNAFTISPQRVRKGESVTLTWSTTGAESVILYRLDYKGRFVEPVGRPLPPSGSLVMDGADQLNQTYYFGLMITAGAVTDGASVRAELICETQWFFPNSPAECPQPATSGIMATQRFEHGLMIWGQAAWGGRDTVFVLYDSGSPAWDIQTDTWTVGMPESDPSIVPPAGRYQPVRGFGKVWREGYVSPIQVVRDRLGWAVEPESSLGNGHVQCDTASYSTCYLSGPNNLVYVLNPERSSWSVR